MNVNKLKEVLAIQTYSHEQFRMFAYLIRQLKQAGCKYWTDNGNIYAVKGNADKYPCIVAHMDTVHAITSNLTVMETNGRLYGFNNRTMKQTGIGGDDKVGVFIALECLSKFDNLKLAFFRDEEVGCEGSYEADSKFFNDCRFVLQCDRKGKGDFITNASGTLLSSKTFQQEIAPFLKEYGYKTAYGFMTDVMALKENGIECSMANISCGYHNSHTKNEYVKVNEVRKCLALVEAIISHLVGDYPMPYKAKDYSGYSSRWNDFDAKYNAAYKSSFDKHSKKKKDYVDYEEILAQRKDDYCDCCSNVGNLKYAASYNMHVCESCINYYEIPQVRG